MPGSVPEDQTPNVVDQVGPSAEVAANVPYQTPIPDMVQQASEFVQREHALADQAISLKAHNDFTDMDVGKLYDPKTGILNQNHGLKAPLAVDQVLNDYKVSQSKIRDTLTNDRQKYLFDQTSDEHFRTVQHQLFDYEARQYKQADAENVDATIKNAKYQALNTYGLAPEPGQPPRLDHQVAIQEATLKDYAKRAGWPESMTTLKIAEAKSDTFYGVGEDMLAKKDTQGVQKLLDDHGADILPEQRNVLTKALEHTNQDNRAQDKANSFLAMDVLGREATPALFFEKLRNDPDLAKDADLYHKVMEYGRDYFSMQHQAKAAEQQEIGSTFLKSLTENPGVNPWSVVGPANRQKLDGETEMALNNAYQQSIRKERPKGPTSTYYNILQMANTPGFEHINIMKYADDLSDVDMRELMKLQVKKSEGKPIDDVVTINDRMNNAMINIGVKRDSDDGLDYMRKFSDAVHSESKDGKPLNSQQLDAIAKTLSTDYVVKSTRGFINKWLHFGNADTTENKGKLFRQSPGEIRSEIDRTMPIAGRMDKEGLNQWVSALRSPSSPGFSAAMEQLSRWKNGIADDGSYDPSLQQEYQAINAELGKGK